MVHNYSFGKYLIGFEEHAQFNIMKSPLSIIFVVVVLFYNMAVIFVSSAKTPVQAEVSTIKYKDESQCIVEIITPPIGEAKREMKILYKGKNDTDVSRFAIFNAMPLENKEAIQFFASVCPVSNYADGKEKAFKEFYEKAIEHIGGRKPKST